MASSRYRNFLQLIEKWPVDKSRGEKDIAVLLRKRVMDAFSKAEASTVNEAECDRAYKSLHRIASDVHRNKWARTRQTNASGSSAEALQQALSIDGLKELGMEGSKGTSVLIKEKLLSVFPSSQSDKKK